MKKKKLKGKKINLRGSNRGHLIFIICDFKINKNQILIEAKQ